ncbi:MAG: iron-sulfur cluster repair di-iron protein [Ignavibacteria bacterium]|mgnify:FL=1|nr:iron-sulfur cluster repair di-iron protein [Ignavibacteria bacterium]
MLVQKENKIGETVAKNFRASKVFESYGLDFCCGGKKSIEAACSEKKIDTGKVLADLAMIQDINDINAHYQNWEPDFLVEYIINNHHTYVTNSISTIEHHLQKVVNAHGERHPETAQVQVCFTDLKNELLDHMAKEEKMLFPYIKKMCFALKNTLEIPAAPFGTVENPIKMMEAEHDNAGIVMKEISTLTDSYTPPADACATFRVLYNELQEFENDLHMHVHLENNILFPKALLLEKKMNQIFETL